MTNTLFKTHQAQPKPGRKPVFTLPSWSGLPFMLADFITQQSGKQHVVFVESAAQAQQLQADLSTLVTTPVMLFPDLEILPYDQFAPPGNIISQRLRVLSQCLQASELIVIATPNALSKRLPPVTFLHQQAFIVSVGQTLDLTKLAEQLNQAGYHRVEQIAARGEFSIRGSILDIFPMGASAAYRIDLFDDAIDSIRLIDLKTQRSSKSCVSVEILPAQEVVFDAKTLKQFQQQWASSPFSQRFEAFYNTVVKSPEAIDNIDFLLPLFYPTMATLLDYCASDNTVFHLAGCIDQTLRSFYDYVCQRYEAEKLRHTDQPMLQPEQVYVSPDHFYQQLKQHAVISWQDQTDKAKGILLPVADVPWIRFNYQRKIPHGNLQTCMQQNPHWRWIFCAESQGRQTQLEKALTHLAIPIVYVNDWQEAVQATKQSQNQLVFLIAPFAKGMVINDTLAVVTEADLFAYHTPHTGKTLHSSDTTDTEAWSQYDTASTVIKTADELTPGMPVVHIEHGVGFFEGMTKLDGLESEFLLLRYANQEKLYVPMESLNAIRLYHGMDQDKITPHQLGSSKWQKQKEQAVAKIKDVATDLLAVYAQRKQAQGYAHINQQHDYAAFCQSFPFKETPDQQQAIESVLSDMQQPEPMDRLVCGDVGFGKTEVAMRAAFMAIANHKQVAVLVPTTLLAQQHHASFTDRFADFPVTIEALTRFKSPKAQQNLIDQAASGQLDVIIGTHKLLNTSLNFKDLGLLIIDEEHRFGVQHKEKLKALRANVDILTMTATPIPRTLSMAFSSLRDLSIIATPPAKRLSVKTFVQPYDAATIQQAIARERLRGGQVFYLFNDVDKMVQKQEKLQKLCPDVQIGIAHGQMRQRELESVMYDFQHNRYQVLLCTTIIETGLDIANANTLIIENADHFGLAQLHQLRGRVGRSHHQAYAYLLTPEALTTTAEKRLTALAETQSIGGGYQIATHDLEIRGAGELLGKEQSGHIKGIGFNLYMELLDKTVEQLQTNNQVDWQTLVSPHHDEVSIELGIPCLLPSSYISDPTRRLSLYQQIAQAQDDQAIEQCRIDLIDRFGPLPEAAEHFIAVHRLRLQAKTIGIKKIVMHHKGGRIELANPLPIDPMILIQKVQSQPQDFQLSAEQKLLIVRQFNEACQRLAFIQTFVCDLYQQAKKIPSSR